MFDISQGNLFSGTFLVDVILYQLWAVLSNMFVCIVRRLLYFCLNFAGIFISISSKMRNYRPHPKDGEGNVFSLFTLGVSGPTRTGWGAPKPGQDGVPPGQDRMGYPPSQDRMGYPQARTGWGTPWPGQDRVPPKPGQDGVPPSQDRMGYPPKPGQDGVPPGQDRIEYPPGQYISCGFPQEGCLVLKRLFYFIFRTYKS